MTPLDLVCRYSSVIERAVLARINSDQKNVEQQIYAILESVGVAYDPRHGPSLRTVIEQAVIAAGPRQSLLDRLELVESMQAQKHDVLRCLMAMAPDPASDDTPKPVEEAQLKVIRDLRGVICNVRQMLIDWPRINGENYSTERGQRLHDTIERIIAETAEFCD